MEEKVNEATVKRPEGHRIIDGLHVNIDLPLLIEQIKNEQAWEYSDRNAITVFKSARMRIVLVALHKGANMIKHEANDIISVLILKGQMLFNTGTYSANLRNGEMLILHEDIEYSLVANEETVFLLTLTPAFVKRS